MSAPALPFAHLNLRRNPFGELTPDERAAVALVADQSDLVERLREPGFVAQFIGEVGRGKSTHLHALRLHFPQAPYVHLPEDEPLPTIPNEPMVFVDETQRLTRRQRKKLFRPDRSLAIGTHADHAAELAKAGMRYQTVHVGNYTPAQLQAMFKRRIEACRRGPGPVPFVPIETAEQLHRQHGDCVRAMEHRLYDVVQAMTEPGAIAL